jgi:hypothetical protein
MAIEQGEIDIRALIAAVEKAIGEAPGSIKGLICTVVFQDDALGLFHNAPDLHVASEAFATALQAVANMQGLAYEIEFL